MPVAAGVANIAFISIGAALRQGSAFLILLFIDKPHINGPRYPRLAGDAFHTTSPAMTTLTVKNECSFQFSS